MINKKIMTVILLLFFSITALFITLKQPLFTQYKFQISLKLKSNKNTLQKHVKALSEINRTTKEGQEKVIDYILDELNSNGISKKVVSIQNYTVKNRIYKNIIVSFGSHNKGIFPENKYIFGAHYDAYNEFPGADDNASGVAGLLEVSRVLLKLETNFNRNIDLVFYATEEPPFFGTKNMGSYHHAKSVKNQSIKLVMIYDMIGYFSEEENSQEYPISFLKKLYPTTGNYISLVTNIANSSATRKVKSRFSAFLQENNFIGVQSINAPAKIQGIDFSDHRNYWVFDFPAILITDTAFYRNKNYHSEEDTYEKLDYTKMKEVVDASIITLLSL